MARSRRADRGLFIPVALLGGFLVLAGAAGAATRYVDLNNPTPAPPYTNWATAATNIQEAVDVAVAGDEILVTNGVYQTGTRAMYRMSNRVAVTQPLTVRSVNGPSVTYVVGSGLNGPAAVRCVYLANGAVLAGFTLTNGATQTSGDRATNQSGGGVWCEGLTAMVSNCVLTGNSAWYAGGAYLGTLNNCALTGNSAMFGGGAYDGTLNNCALTSNSANYGGGAYYATLNNCTLKGNSAGTSGGGAESGTLNNCALTSNSANAGGGAYYATLNNCTLVGNSANYGGGANGSSLYNCIVHYNSGANYDTKYDGILNYCCTTPLPAGPGNLTNAPLFVDTNGWSDLRLQTNSPCINRGDNAYPPGPTDLDGNPRIAGGRVDIGAYEFQGAGLSGFPAWLWQYGLPIDGSADATDPDQDSLNNWQEWQADTDPTNSLSVLRFSSVSVGPPVTVEFLSSSNRLYTLLCATNLAGAPWSSVYGQTDVPGTGSWQTLSDTNAAPPRFYRLGVRMP